MFPIQSEIGKEGSLEMARRYKNSAEARESARYLTAINWILAVGVPQREQDMHALK